MEEYIRKLSECQLVENQLREEREALLKRHEREIEELDARMGGVSQKRNQIIEDFKLFLDSNNLAQIAATAAEELGPIAPNPKILNRSNSAFDPVEPSVVDPALDLLQPENKVSIGLSENVSDGKELLPTSVPTPSVVISSVKSKPARAFKIVQRLTTSKSAGSLASPRCVESPTSNQIESMLSKVRSNVQMLDNSTLNKCIDLLSSRIFKEKPDINKSRIVSPEPTPTIGPTQPSPAVPSVVTKIESDKEETKIQNNNESTKKPESSVKQSSSPTKNNESTKKPESSVKQSSSPTKKRVESAEERRRRIERVLFEKPASYSTGSTGITHSESTLSLNSIDLARQQAKVNHTKSNVSLNRYSNRSKVRRNHSLSPLRFCVSKRQKSEETEALLEGETASLDGQIRKYKSEQFLSGDDLSLLSFDEDSVNDSQNNESLSLDLDPEKPVVPSDVEEEEVHLLAPSKVAKSQELFTQVFFPSDVREKPLMTKEEIARTRSNALNSKIKAASFNEDTESKADNAQLRIDYLNHMRRSSASPETRQREREINSVANTQKFRCYQDFWETKTKEMIDKKNQFEQWQQTNQNTPKIKPIKKIHKEVAKETSISPKSVPSESNKVSGIPIITTKVPQNAIVSNANPMVGEVKKTTNKLDVPQQFSPRKSPSPHSDSEGDKVLEKLRQFQQDIRHRKMKEQMKQQAASAKLAEPQNYHPRNQISSGGMPKTVEVRVVQPNSPEVPSKNRVRLIRSNAREEPDEMPNILRIDLPSQKLAERELRQPVFPNMRKTCFESGSISPKKNQPDLVSLNSNISMRSTYF